MAPPSTLDFSGAVGLILAFAWLLPVAVVRLHFGNLLAVWLGWGSMSIGFKKHVSVKKSNASLYSKKVSEWERERERERERESTIGNIPSGELLPYSTPTIDIQWTKALQRMHSPGLVIKEETHNLKVMCSKMNILVLIIVIIVWKDRKISKNEAENGPFLRVHSLNELTCRNHCTSILNLSNHFLRCRTLRWLTSSEAWTSSCWDDESFRQL